MSRDMVLGAHSSLIFEEIKSRPCVWNVGGGADSSVLPVIESADSRHRWKQLLLSNLQQRQICSVADRVREFKHSFCYGCH